MANETTPAPHKGQLLIYRDGGLRVQVRIDGQTVWLPQCSIAELFQVTVATVNGHLSNIYAEGELDPAATIRKFRIVQREGKRDVSRIIDHYNLDAILRRGRRFGGEHAGPVGDSSAVPLPCSPFHDIFYS